MLLCILSSFMSLISVLLQDLPLSIMKTNVMLKKQFVRLTIFHLVMTSDGYLWSGLGYASTLAIMFWFYLLVNEDM